MDKEVIIEKINNFLIDEFEVESEETLDLDSLDFVDLVVSVESNFGVKLEGKDFLNVVLLEDFYNLIENKLL